MQGSIGSAEHALNNALMEYTIELNSTELIDLETTRRRTGRNEGKRETADWVRWSHDERLHSATKCRPPFEYEQMYRCNQATAPQAA